MAALPRAARPRPTPSSSRVPLARRGVPVVAQESGVACIESYEPHTADIAIPPSAYSTKIVSTSRNTIGYQRNVHSRNSSITTTVAASAIGVSTTRLTTCNSRSSNQRRSNCSLTQTLTQPPTVSLTGPRQPPPLNTIAQQPLRESTHSDTAEYPKKDSAHRDQIRMVWPADSALYDWSPSDSQWDGQPIPIDDLDHVFDPLDYSTPAPFPQQQHLPTPEQAQVWSAEEQATMDRLIEAAIDDDDVFEGFDLDELDNLLAEERPAAEEEPLAEFFPMLGSSNQPSTTSSALASSTTPPLSYHDMTAGPYVDYHQTTTTQTLAYGHGAMEPCGGAGEWVRMGAPDGRIDRSPTFMDTGCDLNVYLNDWYDEPSTSRSSPDYEQYQTPSASTMTASATTTRTTVRYAPYARPSASRTPAPAKRAPVFRPEGFGTPAIGENVDEYRKRRDKNNISSARSRAKKAEVLKEMKAEAVQLEKKNIELKAVLDSLEREVSYYKELMMTALSK